MILSYYDNQALGPVVLFIHGIASAKEIWNRQYNLLEKGGYRVIGVDLRGHGSSSNPEGVCTVDDHLADLCETLENIDISQKINIVGHSFGAVLAVKFAEKYPEKVNKLLLASLPVKVPTILLKYYKWFLGKPIEFLKKKINFIVKLPLKKRFKLAIKSDLNIVRQIWKESLEWDFLSNVPRIKCPVYLSVGRFDYISLVSVVRRLHAQLQSSNYKIFNWSSHTCMEDEPVEFNKWLAFALSLEK